MTTTVPEGINGPNIARFFAEYIPGGDAPLEITLISGGKSNLTYKVASPGHTWVLRRPPLGHALPTAHDMSREYRVLAALAPTDVPSPKPLAFCEDISVNDAPFYVMEHYDGHIIADALPDGYASTPEERHNMGIGMVRTLAKLHAVDYKAVGLGEFGRPEGFVERQVRRWGKQHETTITRPVPELDEVTRRLNNAIPESPAPTIVHGDYRLGNIIMDPNQPGNVVAILDWEMSTLGDPLTDLGYTLLYWHEAGDPPEFMAGSDVTAQPGFASRAELIDEYARVSGRAVHDVDFYVAFAAYKLSIICEGIHYRWINGQTVGEGFEGYDERTVQLARRALWIADHSNNPKLRGS
ncbi:phosphotransferase family protein [bacterium]|nr:phosphotransferase family protein [bacterium]